MAKGVLHWIHRKEGCWHNWNLLCPLRKEGCWPNRNHPSFSLLGCYWNVRGSWWHQILVLEWRFPDLKASHLNCGGVSHNDVVTKEEFSSKQIRPLDILVIIIAENAGDVIGASQVLLIIKDICVFIQIHKWVEPKYSTLWSLLNNSWCLCNKFKWWRQSKLFCICCKRHKDLVIIFE